MSDDDQRPPRFDTLDWILLTLGALGWLLVVLVAYAIAIPKYMGW